MHPGCLQLGEWKWTIATEIILLGNLEESADPDQQHKYGEAVSWTAEAKVEPIAVKAATRSESHQISRLEIVDTGGHRR